MEKMDYTEIGREILVQLGTLQLFGMDSHLPPMKRPLVKGSYMFDKAALVDAHMRFMKQFEELERDWQLMKGNLSKEALMPSLVDTRFSWKKSSTLESMRSIRVIELKVGKRYHGRVLCGTLCVDAFFLSLIQTLIEDEDGNAARVMIDDSSLDGSSSWAIVQAQYRKGMKIAIKAPFLSDMPDESIALSVNTDDLILLSDVPPQSSADINPWAKLDASGLRSQGNQLFAKQDWRGALDLYSKCIQKSMDVGRRKPPSKSKKKASSDNGLSSNGKVKFGFLDTETVVLAYSNRAAAWMKLRIYEKALVDAGEALQLDPNHLKSMYRKGCALHGLQQYEQACECLEGALDQAPQDRDIKLALQRSKTCDLQSRRGVYDLSKYLLSGCEGTPPECSDYLGPVEIRWSDSDGKRGLYVTKDVKAGELLLVSNALAVVRIDASNPASRIVIPSGRSNASLRDDLLFKLFNLAMKSPKWLQQFSSLSDCDHPDKVKIPPLELFRPNSKWKCASVLDMPLGRMKGVVLQNAFDESGSCARVLLAGRSANECQVLGLWPLASFINHSCAPNSVRLHVGDALFLHASTHLEAGEELTLSYVHSLLPAQMRQELLIRDSWEFQCSCSRCELETKLEGPLKQVSKRFQSLWGLKGAVMARRNESFKMAKLALRLEHVLKSKAPYKYETQLIRASFFISYWIAYLNIDQLGDYAIKLPPPETLIDAMSTTAAGDAMSLFFAAYWLKRFEEQGASSAVVHDAQNRAMHICRCLYGEQKSDVLKRLIKAHGST